MFFFYLFIAAVQAQQNCNVTMIEGHSHFTRVTDKHLSRECSYQLSTDADVFLDIERYSDTQILDRDAQLNITVGSTTININNIFVRSDSHQCSVPMRTKLEQTIWLWLHFENNAMIVQVSPAKTAFFGHCFTVDQVRQPTSLHMVGKTQTGMEQVLRGIHAHRPALQDPGQTVVMRKTIHEIERRLHNVEKAIEPQIESKRGDQQKYHSDKYNKLYSNYKGIEDNLLDVQQTVGNMHGHIENAKRYMDRPQWLTWVVCCIVCIGIFVVYKVWVLTFTQHKLLKFKL